MIQYKKYYNIYYGTIGNSLKCEYKFTKLFNNDKEASDMAKSLAESLYYKNEGKKGIPSFSQLMTESELTGISLETLYKEHMYDMIRFFAIPTDMDSIPSKKLKFWL